MACRRGSQYKSYLDASRSKEGNKVQIPETTWRRWLRQGKITVERLQELGIQTGLRRPRAPNNSASGSQEDQPMDMMDKSNEAVPSSSGGSDTLPHSLQRSNSADSDSSEWTSVCDPLDSSMTEDADNSLSFISSAGSDGENSDAPDEESNIALTRILNSKFISPAVLNAPLHPNLPVTKFEILIIILHLAMRHKMTDVFVEHLFTLIDSVTGIPNSLGMSKHLFNKLFMFGKRPVVHFYCPECSKYLGTEKTFDDEVIECDNETCDWSSTVSSLNDSHYFLTLDLRDQLRDVLSKPDTKFVTRDRLPNVMSDMMDGKEYTSKCKPGRILSNPNALTLTLSTDGSPVFKSGPNSLWPVHFYLNEIEPQQRFNAENIVLGGVWFGKREPHIQMFLKPIVEELQELETLGVVWTKPNGVVVESPVFLLCCCTDSVARPKVQHHMQFNGSFGCGYCLHPNTSITIMEKIKNKTKVRKKGGKGKADAGEEVDEVEVFRPKQALRYVRGEYDMRTNTTLREHMELAAVSELGPVMGCTGRSILCELKQFNVVHGFVIDYLHCTLLGTMKRLAGLWFDSTSQGSGYYIGRSVHRVDLRIDSITLPSGFRSPRPMSDRVHWKGNEWRTFLFYYGLPVLLNILPEMYYNHFKKFVTAIYTLTKESILNNEVVDAHNLLQEFVWEYQDLYGEANMVYNVHITTHLAQIVSRMGPLWAYSAFPFESANGRLVKLAMGTKGVATQVCRKYLMTSSVSKLLMNGYKVSDGILNICCDLVGLKYVKHATKGTNCETLLGKQFYHELSTEQRQALLAANIQFANEVLAVNRAVFQGKLYHSRLTTRQKKACDSCIRLKSGEYALIDLIFICRPKGQGTHNKVETFFLVTILNIALDFLPSMVSHIKQCSVNSFGSTKVITAPDISRKCIFYSCSDKNYVAEITNNYETD